MALIRGNPGENRPVHQPAGQWRYVGSASKRDMHANDVHLHVFAQQRTGSDTVPLRVDTGWRLLILRYIIKLTYHLFLLFAHWPFENVITVNI